MLRQEFLLYGIEGHIFFPPTMFTKGYEEENKVKPKLTLKIEEGDDGLTAEQAAEILFKGILVLFSGFYCLRRADVSLRFVIFRGAEGQLPDHRKHHHRPVPGILP